MKNKFKFDDFYGLKYSQLKLKIIKTLIQEEISVFLTKYSETHKMKKINFEDCHLNFYGRLSFRGTNELEFSLSNEIQKIINCLTNKYQIIVDNLSIKEDCSSNNKYIVFIDIGSSIFLFEQKSLSMFGGGRKTGKNFFPTYSLYEDNNSCFKNSGET